MKTTTKAVKVQVDKPNLTKLEKQFIIAYYESVADTLNFSKCADICIKGLKANQIKGVFGSLVNKGVFNPCADAFNHNGQFEEYMGMTGLLSIDDKNEIAKEFGYYFDFEEMDYDYLRTIKA